MTWYRINVNYLWHKTDKMALETSSPAGKDKQKAIEQYNAEIANNMHCCDDNTKPAKIDLTEYTYNEKTNKTHSVIIYKNY